jgi:hypothetical protein
MMSAATLRLTKLCVPKCMQFKEMAVTTQEEKCLERCVKTMYKTHVKTLEFFQNFEKDYEQEKKALAD